MSIKPESPPLRIRIHIPPQLSYTTTAAIYHHISTTNPSSCHIRFVFEIHLDSDSCFLAGVGFGKKKSRVATLRLGPKFFENAFFEKISGYPIFRCFWVFWDRCHYRKFFLTRFQFLGPGSWKKKNWSKNFVPILSVWARKSFETLAIIVIFRKKKTAQKK